MRLVFVKNNVIKCIILLTRGPKCSKKSRGPEQGPADPCIRVVLVTTKRKLKRIIQFYLLQKHRYRKSCNTVIQWAETNVGNWKNYVVKTFAFDWHTRTKTHNLYYSYIWYNFTFYFIEEFILAIVTKYFCSKYS